MAKTLPIPLRVRNLGQRDYESVWHAMQTFTDNRSNDTLDEIWLVEHTAVFTQGQAGRSEHLLNPGDIPVIQVDRGGQVTYHGPGQLIAYILIDLHRAGFGIKRLVSQIENSLIALLSDFNITAETRTGAPGVYVDDCKIAALGLRVRKGRTFHGLSLNVDMNLEPFSRINPCGFPGLVVTQIADLRPDAALDTVPERLLHHLSTSLGYTLLSDYADDLPT